MSLDTVSEFDKLLKSSELLFGLVYRGHWCPFCLDHVRSLKEIEKQIHDAGGQTVLITSERKEHLEKVRSATDYTGPVIVDDENVLVKELKERKVADIAISSMTMRRYDHGMAQPAVFVLKQDGTVLYTWAIVPGLMNLGGAKDRPSVKDIWENVDAKMHGKEEPHTSPTTAGVLSVLNGRCWPF